MASENETIAEIEEELRSGEYAPLADRIEAAWKRERGEIESRAIDHTTEHMDAVHRDDCRDCVYREAGNAAAMREALLALSAWAKIVKDHPKDKTATECAEFVEQAVNAALSAPARNCDIHTDFNDAITTIADERNWHDGKWDSERYCILASWLLATAAEQKGAGA